MPTAAKIPKGAVQMYCSLCSGIGGSLWAEYPITCTKYPKETVFWPSSRIFDKSVHRTQY